MNIRTQLTWLYTIATITLIVVVLSVVRYYERQLTIDLLWKYGQIASTFDFDSLLHDVEHDVSIVEALATNRALVAWAQDTDHAQFKHSALQVLHDFHQRFQSKNSFIALDQSLEYYFFDSSQTSQEEGGVLQHQLEEGNEHDRWFFDHKASALTVNVNLDYSKELNEIFLWINQAIYNKGEFLGIAGTGLEISEYKQHLKENAEVGINTILVDQFYQIQLPRRPQPSQQDPKPLAFRSIIETVVDEQDYLNIEYLMERQRLGQEPDRLVTKLESSNVIAAIEYFDVIDWYEISFINEKHIVQYKQSYLIYILIAIVIVIFSMALYTVIDKLFIKPIVDTHASLHRYLDPNNNAKKMRFIKKPSNEIGAMMSQLELMTHPPKQKSERQSFQSTPTRHDLHSLETLDPLTGLYSKVGIEREISKAIAISQREGTRFGLLWVDIEQYNCHDLSLSSDIDDEVSYSVAAAIQTCVREYDSVCRWSYRDFLLMTNTDSDRSLEDLCKRLVRQIRSVPMLSDYRLTIGGACIDSKDSMRDALAKADGALYLAKRSVNKSYVLWSVADESVAKSLFDS
ncbi:GGDEF domain-containing protein [Vibrio genomosp. F10]|uniref:GGDEF domain-containing protein n=1 Tax=Vibrio genomosp. F10 TaxID=723171 RepID=UPI000474BEB8|nr:GGDEF domain-containing protein [Vibrio genomosp. F10]OEF10405.1 hypothetical protein A1QI_00895 [Vibrio genomosp. F10 str. 9ZB36]